MGFQERYCAFIQLKGLQSYGLSKFGVLIKPSRCLCMPDLQWKPDWQPIPPLISYFDGCQFCSPLGYEGVYYLVWNFVWIICRCLSKECRSTFKVGSILASLKEPLWLKMVDLIYVTLIIWLIKLIICWHHLNGFLTKFRAFEMEIWWVGFYRHWLSQYWLVLSYCP